MKKSQISKDNYQYAVWTVLAAMVLLFVTTVFAFNGPVGGSLEVRLLTWIYGWSPSLRNAFWCITQLASGWSVAVIALLLWFIKHRVLAYVLMMASMSTFAIVELMKTIIERPRPYQVFANIVSRDGQVPGYGFPSGHAAMATLLTVLLWGIIPRRLQWLLPLIASLVCLSRIYLGVHSPLDIIGGVCVGLIIGFCLKMPWLKIKSSLAQAGIKA